MKRRMLEVFEGTWLQMRKPYYQGVAAEFAFFFLLSVIPLVIILAELLGFFSISIDILQELIRTYGGSDLLRLTQDFFEYKPSGTINVIFLLFALWAASKAQFSLIRIANYTYTGRNAGKGYIRERLRSIGTVLLPIILLIVAIPVLFYGDSVAGILDLYTGQLLHTKASLLEQLWNLLRWPLAIAVYFAVISLTYYLIPMERGRFRDELPGAVLASVGMLLVTFLYSYYISHYSNYDLLYGSLATVVGLLMWFYILGFVLVIGIVFNAVMKDLKEEKRK